MLWFAAILSETPGEVGVVMHTSEWMRERRAGERWHRRVSLDAASELPAAIRALADKGAAREPRERGPTRAELLEWTRARRAACASEGALVKLEALERALSMRERPARGPLAEPDVWAVELALSEGRADDALEQLDAIERGRGRLPATAYLRARASLLLGQEEARAIAERVSALALSMNAFHELELLAAEAWERAGDARRAQAYARDLADNKQVDAQLRARAAQNRGRRARTDEGPPATATTNAPARDAAADDASAAIEIERDPFSNMPPAPAEPAVVAPPIQPAPIVAVDANGASGAAARASARASDPGHATASGLVAAARAAQASIEAPASSVEPDAASAPSRADPRGEPDDPVPAPARLSTRLSHPPVDDPRPRTSAVPSRAPRERVPSEPDDDDGDGEGDSDAPSAMRGGSQPPYRTEPPPASFPRAPLVPIVGGDRTERVESLSLPPGLHGETSSPDTLPTTPLEARVYFTTQARELARDYKKRFGTELRTDVRSLEIVQRNLAERFPDGVVSSADDVAEVRRHGAFLGEMLARRLGAEWTDFAVSELGYWSMNVPPGVKVWPIGRVIRFVTMRHRERDLVSYFLELQARANGIR